MFSTVYLEAQGRPQPLYTLKWQLRAAGVEVYSTWHDESLAGPDRLLDHLQNSRVQRLKSSDALVILHPAGEEFSPELAVLLGLALSSGVQVVWIGEALPMLAQFPSIRCFASSDEFIGELSRTSRSKLAA